MTDNFEKDINVPSKEIIVKFSDGYCIVLENNEISMRENEFTKLQIVFGKQTNELLEFVKELYLNKKVKEQECEEINLTNERLVAEKYIMNEEILKLKQALDEIEKIANKQRKFDLTGKTPLTPVINEVGGDFIDILDIIDEVKENIR